MMMKMPDNIAPENYRFFVITQIAYIVGLAAHFALGILFYSLDIHEMAWFNFFLSVPIFSTALALNRLAFQNLAFSLAIFELYFHQVTAVYFLGWDSGFQYYLIYLAALPFFNARWSVRLRVVFILFICVSYVILYTFFKDPGAIRLTPIFYYILYTSSAIMTLILLVFYINYFVRSADRAETDLKQANLSLSKKNAQIQVTLKQRDSALSALDRELSEASDYVRSILPQPITEDPIRIDWRFIPSTSLGGDAFGYHWLDEDHFAFYLIDVSGHGVGAALLSISVVNALRSQTLHNTDLKDPEGVMSSLNNLFPGEKNNDMFFTMWYGVYNKTTRELTYASAGHPPALSFDHSDSTDSPVIFLRTPNYVIGGIPNIGYKKSKHHIGPQTKLFVFSDGVYEIEKSDGKMWRFSEFADFMISNKSDVQKSLDGLYRHALKLGRSKKLEDDFTIMEIEFA